MLVIADAFATVTALILIGGVLVLLAIGRWHSRSGTEIMDEDRKGRWGAQAEIESRDIGEMVDAANQRRGRRGAPAETEGEVVERVTEEELSRLASDPGTRGPEATAGSPPPGSRSGPAP